MTSRRAVTALFVPLFLASCSAVGPDYRLPDDSAYHRVQQHPVALDSAGSKAVDANQALGDGYWWRLYQDPYLNGLVEQALRGNAELRVAEARLLQARAQYQEAAGAQWPDWAADASVSRSRLSAESMGLNKQLPPSNLASGNLGVSYNIDLFGQIRRGIEAAAANTQAVQAANDLARINVAAAVVEAYVEVCHGNHELAVAEHSLSLQQASQDVAERMYSNGRGNSVDVERAASQVAVLRAAIPPLQAQRRAAGYQLAALLDLTPDKVPARAMACVEAPDLERPIPVGDGATLLRRRPDVRQAERRLASATAGIGVAVADLYPKVSLGASAGASGQREDFGKPATQAWSIGPLVSWSIPGPAARARVAVAQAGAQIALAEFDQVVLNALRETQTLLDGYAQDLLQTEALRAARDRAETASVDERRLYQSGRHPYLEQLDAERSLASAEAQLASAEARLSRDQVDLFLALGGGWRGNTESLARDARTP